MGRRRRSNTNKPAAPRTMRGGGGKSIRGGGGGKSMRGGGGSSSSSNDGKSDIIESNDTGLLNKGSRSDSVASGAEITPVSGSGARRNSWRSSRSGRTPSSVVGGGRGGVDSPAQPPVIQRNGSNIHTMYHDAINNVHSRIAERLEGMSRVELETKVMELQSTVEVQRNQIEHLSSELRIQEGLRKRSEERQSELHKLEMKHLNKEKIRDLQLAAMDAVRHPAELLLEEKMHTIAASRKEESLLAGNTSSDGEDQKNTLNDLRQSDEDFLNYLDQFQIRTSELQQRLV